MNDRERKERIEMASYWFVSDKVSPHVITGATKDCESADCNISCRVQGTTQMAITDHYNKFGGMIIRNPNHFTAFLYCKTCHHGWKVDGEGKILTHHDYSKEDSDDEHPLN